MRARPYDFCLSLLGGVAVGLMAVAAPAAAAVPTGAVASAASLDEAWRACNAAQLHFADRIANCTIVIESGRAKPALRARALVGRGFGHVLQKDLDGALADFNAAIRDDPKLATAYYYRGAIQVSRDPKRALADLNKAISLNPKDADYFRERSSIHVKRKDPKRAIADLTIAISLSKNPKREYFLRAAAYEDIGQRGKAIADFQAVLLLDPDDEVIRRHIVTLGGTIPQAVQLPAGPCSADVISHEDRIAGCTAVIDSGTLTGWPLKVTYCNRGYSLTELGRYDDVIADSNKLLASMPDTACGYLNRGRAWYYKDDLDQAIADYTKAISFDPRMHEAYASRGTAYYDRREFDVAIANYDRAIAIDRFVPMYFSDRGNTRYQMGDNDRAIADYNSAIALDPKYAPAYTRRGWAFLGKDDLARAEADLDKALELSPDDTYAQRGRAEVSKRQNKPVPETLSTGLYFDKFRRLMGQPEAEAPAQEGRP